MLTLFEDLNVVPSGKQYKIYRPVLGNMTLGKVFCILFIVAKEFSKLFILKESFI